MVARTGLVSSIVLAAQNIGDHRLRLSILRRVRSVLFVGLRGVVNVSEAFAQRSVRPTARKLNRRLSEISGQENRSICRCLALV